MNRSKFGGIIKKATAVILSMAMAFGAVSVLPNSFVKDNAIVASADTYAINDCIFEFNLTTRTGVQTACIYKVDILNDEGIVKIPETVKYQGVEYTVTDLGWNFLFRDTKVKNLIMPNTIELIGSNVLWNAPIEKLTLSDNLEEIGYGFCMNCVNLKRENVVYDGTKLKTVGEYVFLGADGMYDENSVISLNNCLIRYRPKEAYSSLEVADLGSDGVKIDRMGPHCLENKNALTSVNLEGVINIGDEVFKDCSNLTQVKNYDGIQILGNEVFKGTPWLDNSKKDGLCMIGPVLLYYKTDSNIIDLTSGNLAGTTFVGKEAFADCRNADTLIVNSDVIMDYDCFYEAYKQPYSDQGFLDRMPVISTHKIKNIYLDGKKLEYSEKTPVMPEWVKRSYMALWGSEWIKINCEAKTKDLCEQLDIPYYGMNNDKIGTHTPEEEFYIMLKIHEYLSMYDYDHNVEFRGSIGSFLLGGLVDCQGYGDLAHYLCECAGVESKSLYCPLSNTYHVWNSVRIGDEWFENDNGWDAQNGVHNYGWFGLSTEKLDMQDPVYHAYDRACDSWHISLINGYEYIASSERIEALRTIGDLNGDHTRDQKDVDMLWNYIIGNINIKNIKAADINFDGVVDITDGVLLDNFVNGTAVDNDNIPDDRLAAGYRAVFANSRVPEEIDTTSFVRVTTDRYRYIELPEVMYDIPEGKKFGGWDYGQEGKPGKEGQKVQISNPYTVITPVWKDESDPDDDMLLGDVDGSGAIDISDVSKLINHINGVKALDEEEFLRADVNKSDSVDISDASAIVNHINGIKAIEGTV